MKRDEHPPEPPSPLSWHDVRKVAAEADVDVRTVERVVCDWHPPRSRALRAVLVRALRKLGFKEHAEVLENGVVF